MMRLLSRSRAALFLLFSFDVRVPLLLASLSLRLLFLSSVLDIHFRPHVSSDVDTSHCPSYGHRGEAAAKRVIFFMVDGLRADLFFQQARKKTRFLHEIMTKKGVAGVAHAGVPTESRFVP